MGLGDSVGCSNRRQGLQIVKKTRNANGVQCRERPRLEARGVTLPFPPLAPTVCCLLLPFLLPSPPSSSSSLTPSSSFIPPRSSSIPLPPASSFSSLPPSFTPDE
eukprot:GHVT01041415.1.p2 GENE.GHVT01041415.1~~GHVT01041415.1.p2  ORF type:complete len:105 (+),score=36.03 GHVT01041415.1:533-847(+)